MTPSRTLRDLGRVLANAGQLRVHVAGVEPGALHYLLPQLADMTGRGIVALVRDVERAEALWSELACLSGQEGQVGDVLLLPPAHLSPYLPVSADPARGQVALGTLSRLAGGHGARFLVAPVNGPLLAACPARELLARSALELEVASRWNRELLLVRLGDLGYVRVATVTEEGTFAVRGSLLDLFSPGEPLPVRIDFFGDEVESIAAFDPVSQLSGPRQDKASAHPATLVLPRQDLYSRVRPALLSLADELSLAAARLSEVTDALRRGELPLGYEAFLPLLLDAPATPLDCLDPHQWLCVLDDEGTLLQAVDQLHATEQKRFDTARSGGRLALPPSRLLLDKEGLRQKLAAYTLVNVAPLDPGPAAYRFTLSLERPFPHATGTRNNLPELKRRAAELLQGGWQVAVSAADRAEAHRLAHLLSATGVPVRIDPGPLTFTRLAHQPPRGAVEVFRSPLRTGVAAPDLGLFVATGHDLFGRKPASPGRPAPRTDAERLLELEEGQAVVHRDYGIGRFLGVERRTLPTGDYTCLKIEYAQGDVLFVPVHHAAAVQKYIGSGTGMPRLDRLGGSGWKTRVSKARAAARHLAIDLLQLYARRKSAHGFAYSPADEYFEEFEATFPYEETPGQQQAILDVYADMERAEPMDRLVCGDVGFGKTEVAIRAAFKAVLDSRQVAVLVPTTVLCEQHRLTFSERLAGYPVIVDSISRFKSEAQQKDALKRLREGRIDIVIGTHRLLSKDVRFKSLGLVIVDEEHRFGVAHKEKLKAYRAAVDVLSLTATPIPRTLHMALSGIRDLSVIDTPPPGRLDIATQIVHHDPELLAAAIRTELDRDGQVFFLHNRVDDIDTVAETLATLVPEARIGIAHGQMREHQLEAAMLSFMHRKYDLLLCTTIIESGLDLPNVNTLIVNQADRFGLAQLYQIRGRIGRSSRKAFAYFVVPPLETMTGDARSRLAVLAKFSAVGSGFRVAEMDLELRGAGDLLGADQAGHIAGVGFDMYIHLLQEAVERLRAVEERPERTECTVEIPVAASIPESYIEDRHARLVAYRRIATADSLPGLEALRHELKDRFGPVPALTVRLFSVAELRLRGQALGLSKIECTGTQVRIHVAACPDAVLQKLVHLIARQPLRLSAAGDRILAADFSHEPETDPVSRTRRVLALMEK